jgi:hypothetical protein
MLLLLLMVIKLVRQNDGVKNTRVLRHGLELPTARQLHMLMLPSAHSILYPPLWYQGRGRPADVIWEKLLLLLSLDKLPSWCCCIHQWPSTDEQPAMRPWVQVPHPLQVPQ